MFLRTHRDEELRAIRVGTRIRHGQNARMIEVVIRANLVIELIARCAVAGSEWVAALNHEIRDYSVRRGTRVQWRVFRLAAIGIGPGLSARREPTKIGDGFRSIFFE